jgi:uncharacterized protein (TIGR03086 family)
MPASKADRDVLERFDAAVAGFQRTLDAVSDDMWTAPTPCTEWDVRALTNHVCGEQRWLAALVGGQSMAQVGSSLDGDLLGDDPVAAYARAAADTRATLQALPSLSVVVELSGGPTSVQRYCDEVGADTLIHTWDLARAVGADERLPADLLEVAATVVEPWLKPDGIPGVFAARLDVPDDADAQTRLLAALGRRA